MAITAEPRARTRRPASGHNELVDQILALITQHTLALGTVTSEDRVCQLLAPPGGPPPSRTPVRIALATLQAHGFVTKRPQVGCLFVPVDADELDEITSLRTTVESRIFQNWSIPELPQSLKAADKRAADAAGEGSVDALLVADRDFHEEAARLAGNLTGAALISVWGDKLRVAHAERGLLSPESAQALVSSHQDILENLGYPERASEAVVDHIDRLHAAIGGASEYALSR